jgi:hypothetical protein
VARDARIRVGGLYGNARQGACVAYVCFEEIWEGRQQYAWRGAQNDQSKRDEIITARCRRAFREMQPAVAEEDAYIGSILIAQAHDQWVAMQEAGAGAGWLEEEVFAVHAIGLPTKCAEEVYFYTARIPGGLLAGLRRPNERFEWGKIEILLYRVNLTMPKEAATPLWQIMRRHMGES